MCIYMLFYICKYKLHAIFISQSKSKFMTYKRWRSRRLSFLSSKVKISIPAISSPQMIREEPALSGAAVSLESNLELICRPWLMRSHGSLPATPTRLLASPLERSGRETPVSVDSLPLEWDHTGDVGGSSSHEDEEEEEEEQEDDRTYFSAPSGGYTEKHID